MKLRSGVTTPPSFGDGEDDGGDMNASLWGELQSFVDLSLIYAKLPLAPFFCLRQVCKEWNRLASDRQFLEQHFQPPISNLYFVVAQGTGHRLWTSSRDSSGSWTSSPLPRRRCEVSGLLYEDSDRHRVFDLHTRVFYSLPPLPSGATPSQIKDDRFFVGMTVNTTLIPYGFRVFITDASRTHIYDSNSGVGTIPTYSRSRSIDLTRPSTLSCTLLTRPSTHYKTFLYMLMRKWIGLGCLVETYDLDKHARGYECFRVPGSGTPGECGIGVWRDQWFAFEVNSKFVVTAWQMNTQFYESWTEFDCMPKDLCKWMMKGLGHQNVLSTFCGEHVLVYNCLEAEERAVLYNLDQKTWDKVEVFEKTVHVPK